MASPASPGQSCSPQNTPMTSASPFRGQDTAGSALKSGAGESELVCFGMLSGIDIRLSKQCPDAMSLQFAPVCLNRKEVVLEDRKLLVGTIGQRDSHVLGDIMRQKSLVLETYTRVAMPESKRNQAVSDHLSLCAIIYGPLGYSDYVGQWLQECDLYLQDPVRCSRNVYYRNPHRLFPPEADIKTFQLQQAVECELEHYDNPADILEDLECAYELTATPTPSALATPLFEHQMQALTFMRKREQGWSLTSGHDIWRQERDHNGTALYVNNITDEQTFQRPPSFRGGILGDSMGLGKSLTTIALIASDKDYEAPLSSRGYDCSRVRSTLLVVRAPLLKTWEYQLSTHVRAGALTWLFHHGTRKVRSTEEVDSSDIVITTYHTLLAEWKRNGTGSGLIFPINWRRIVLDEAHDIRDHRRSTCKAICALEADCRWAITGTPLQNRLLDLGSLFQFLQVHPYGSSLAFQSLTTRLVANFGQEVATERLRQLVRCVMLRRSLATVTLPEREDLICRLEFTAEEAQIYNNMKQRSLLPNSSFSTGSDPEPSQFTVLQLITQLRMVCNLGLLYRNRNTQHHSDTESDWNKIVAQEIFNGLVASGTAFCNVCHADLNVSPTETADRESNDSDKPLVFKCGWLMCSTCFASEKKTECSCINRTAHSALPVSALSSTLHFENGDQLSEADMPTKIRAVLADLGAATTHEKCIVFSFWTSTLDIIEQGLKNRGIGYVRFDGTIAHSKRHKALDAFRKVSTIRVALLTISCGATGLDLTAASRAYLMEPHWNPSIEQQALARIHRMGQMRPVTTVRYIMRDSFEDHIVKVQHEKQELSQLLLSETNSSNSANRLELLRSML